jgi:hypothetical protein
VGGLGVEPVRVDALAQVHDVEPARRPGGGEPASQQQQADPGELHRAPAQHRGEHEHRDAGEAVAETPDDRVDERLRLEGLAGGTGRYSSSTVGRSIE